MSTEDYIKNLQKIRNEVTSLGHKYLESQLPLEMDKVIEKCKPWGDAEQAIEKIILELKN